MKHRHWRITIDFETNDRVTDNDKNHQNPGGYSVYRHPDSTEKEGDPT